MATQQLGNRPLGYPTSDEIVNPDGFGRRQEFQNTAAIYWNANQAWAVRGAIRDRWNVVNAERPDSLLGYPLSDEVVLPDGQGRMNRFQRGVIYFSPTTGAWDVSGAIEQMWAGEGYEAGAWGYPTGAQYQEGQYIKQPFQHGTIAYTAEVPVSACEPDAACFWTGTYYTGNRYIATGWSGCQPTVAPLRSSINNTGYVFELFSGPNCTGKRAYAGSPYHGFAAQSMNACFTCRPSN
ncbi:peptidase inhibitor family I36 protein [Rhodococcus sp. NPDC059968]|uniref:peptidase inhibitor family I36 protein n=1 Tax=Rhodococcus sp. NPDC059968 TaxID=3347017 RepID=UPI0036704D20